MNGWTSSAGAGTLPAPGAAIGTGTVVNSRAVSSWYFGDGAALFNQTFRPGNAAQLTPLDPALTEGGPVRPVGPSLGFRLAVPLTRRLSAEIDVEENFGHPGLKSSTHAAIETSTASFLSAWTAVLAPATSTSAVSSKSLVPEGAGTQQLVSAALTFEFRDTGTVVPYVSLGGGIVSTRGDGITATLVGNYHFTVQADAAIVPFSETDSVAVHYSEGGASYVALFGGGIKHQLSPHQGVRLGARLYLGHDRSTIAVDARPSKQLGSPAGVVDLVVVNGAGVVSPTAVQFSTVAGVPSSLRDTIEGFQTFAGSGWRAQLGLSVGYYVRF